MLSDTTTTAANLYLFASLTVTIDYCQHPGKTLARGYPRREIPQDVVAARRFKACALRSLQEEIARPGEVYQSSFFHFTSKHGKYHD